jgi:hypothetical protein
LKPKVIAEYNHDNILLEFVLHQMFLTIYKTALSSQKDDTLLIDEIVEEPVTIEE